jgi:hypothetical protein
MSNTSTSRTKWLVGAAIVACIVAVSGTGRAIKNLLAPTPAPVAAIEQKTDKATGTRTVHRTARPWKAYQTTDRRRAPDPDREPFKVVGMAPSDIKEIQQAQSEGFRLSIAENSGDDMDATLSSEDIAAMERDGVMAW